MTNVGERRGVSPPVAATTFLEFQTAVEESFDVQMLPDLRFPEVVGFQKETLQHTFSVPAEKSQ